MKKENQVESSKLKELVRQRFGEKDRDRLKDSQDLEKNRETWIRHRTYVNNCINECLEYSNGVKQYDGMNEEEARKLFLKNLVTHRENNNQKFGENMNQ